MSHYFRGTTKGYLGNGTSQRLGVTCVSTDPRKATLFAIDSSRFGSGIIQIVSKSKIPQSMIHTDVNCFADLESEVVLNMKPVDFLNYVEISVTLTQAKTVMTTMGVTFPATGISKGEMNDWLRSLPPLTNDFTLKFLNAIRKQ